MKGLGFGTLGLGFRQGRERQENGRVETSALSRFVGTRCTVMFFAVLAHSPSGK